LKALANYMVSLLGIISSILTAISAVLIYIKSDEIDGVFRIALILAFLLLVYPFFVSSILSKDKYTTAQKQYAFNGLIYKALFDAYLLFFVFCNILMPSFKNYSVGISVLLVGFMFMGMATIIDQKAGNRKANLIRIVKSIWFRRVIYLAALILFKIAADYYNVLADNLLILLLFHIACVHFYLAAKWPKVRSMITFQESIPKEQIENIESKILEKSKWYSSLFIKSVQYITFTILAIVMAELSFDSVNIAFIGVYLVFFAMLIGWMGRYQVSFAGRYYIYGMLSVMSCLLILECFTYVMRTAAADGATGLLYMIVNLSPIIFWWKLDVFSIIQKRYGSHLPN